MHSPGGVSYFLLSRQRDVIASFSFGACTACTEFLVDWKLLSFCVLRKVLSFITLLFTSLDLIDHYVFSKPASRGLWPHDGGFDPHSVCAHCRDKKKGTDPCVEKPEVDCALCNTLTPEQLTQLSTPSYKLKKEKKEAKSSTPSKEQAADTLSPTLVDPAPLV